MIALSILSAVALVPPMVVARDVPVFTLDCSAATGYPEACDTHCFAAACSGSGTRGGNNFRDVAKYLHFAEDSSIEQPKPGTSTSEADYRRNAIGCGSSDCTTRGTGLSCDEFPYASTYDGGLGCLTSRFSGAKSEIATTGVTHCAKLTHNTAHGRALKSFYDTKALGNGAKFQIGFNEANIDDAAACKLIRSNGVAACRPLIQTGLFKVVRSLPGPTSYCPDRPNLRRSLRERLTEEDLEEYEPQPLEWHSSVDAHGNKLLLPFANGPLEAGTSVFHGIGNGTTLHSFSV